MTTKDVKLPSGLTVTIKAPGVLALHTAFGALPVLDPEQAAEPGGRDWAERALAWFRLVCACCVEPRLSIDDPPPAGRQYIDDVLDADDYNALSAALTELMPRRDRTAEAAPFSATGTPA